MTNRITNKHLEILVNQLNKLTNSPTAYADKTNEFKVNIGHYHIDSAYNGHKLVRTINESGGETNITAGGYVSKGQLYKLIDAYISGIESVLNTKKDNQDEAH